MPRVAFADTADVWALGVLMYEFLAGFPPFEGERKETVYKRITLLDLKFPSHFSEEAKDLKSQVGCVCVVLVNVNSD